MSQQSLEQRLALLEQEVAALKQHLAQLDARPNWLERVTGSMKDNPAFPEAMRLGAAIRRADRPADDR
jgi:hypothetical protein